MQPAFFACPFFLKQKMSLDSKRLMMDNFLSVIEGQKLDKKLSRGNLLQTKKTQCHKYVWNAS